MKYVERTQQHVQLSSSELRKRKAYRSPGVVILGPVRSLTRGSGGEYSDECTSGQQPGDE